MQGAVGGNVRYPNLQSISNLFRFGINDTANNTGGSGTGTGNSAGLIMPNANPDIGTLLDAAIPELYSDLRNIGDPQLIVDNYIVSGLPALAQTDPAVQVALGYQGFFDGFQWHPQWTLPIGLSKMLAVWERHTNANEDFIPMKVAPFGLPGGLQGNRMGVWEPREGMMWMRGSLDQTDLRIRCRITYPDPIWSVNLDFNTTYVPIVDSKLAIVAKMRIQYALRFAPELYQTAVAEEARLMAKLKQEVVRQMQANENQRQPFGDEAVQDFAIAWEWL